MAQGTTRTALKFDKLNRLGYKDYFGKMFITPQQMRRRIDLARDIETVMLYYLAYLAIADEIDIPLESIKEDVESKLTTAVERHLELNPFVKKRITAVVDEIAETTLKHLSIDDDDGSDDSDEEAAEATVESALDDDEDAEEDEQNYWLSYERAMLISANEANAFENSRDLQEAKAQGKKYKKWRTEMDEKVRLDHFDAEGQTVGIDGLFLIGGYEMAFPMDDSHGAPPQETINCRCSCEYTDRP